MFNATSTAFLLEDENDEDNSVVKNLREIFFIFLIGLVVQFAVTAPLMIPKKVRICFLIHVLFLMKHLPFCSYENIRKDGQRMF